MSRTYKVARVKHKGRRANIIKRYASKRVRKHPDPPDGKQYKRLYDSYNICDSISDTRFDDEPLNERHFRKNNTFYYWT